MFTGLVEEIGKVLSSAPSGAGIKFSVSAKKILSDAKIGDSIAINGACLTIVEIFDNGFSFDVSPETLERTNLGLLKIGDYVNLERALRLSDRLGGHLVQGHIDTTAKIKDIIPLREHTIFKIDIPQNYRNLIVEKGSIAIDGISLTINKILNKSTIELNIIPHTIKETNLQFRKIGDVVNVEFDIIGKYVLNALKHRKDTTLENLLRNF